MERIQNTKEWAFSERIGNNSGLVPTKWQRPWDDAS